MDVGSNKGRSYLAGLEPGFVWRTIRMLELQADLKPLSWRPQKRKGGLEEELSRLKGLRVKAEQNLSKLEVWAGQREPKGEVLSVAKFIYVQYRSELAELSIRIDKLQGWIDSRCGKG